MKIQTKTQYVFEPGDILRFKGWHTVAIRNNGYGDKGRIWSTTDGTHFSDATAEKYLEDRGGWEYIGKADELAAAQASS